MTALPLGNLDLFFIESTLNHFFLLPNSLILPFCWSLLIGITGPLGTTHTHRVTLFFCHSLSWCCRYEQKGTINSEGNTHESPVLMNHGWKLDMGCVCLKRAVQWKHCHYYSLRSPRPGPHAMNLMPRNEKEEKKTGWTWDWANVFVLTGANEILAS